LRHYPVLLPKVLEYLNVDSAGTYVDCTAGEGGYAEAILERLSSGHLLALDRDADALAATRKRLHSHGAKTTLFHSSYGEIGTILGERKVHGIVADLGVSRRQFDTPERGFSLQSDGPLDMRMDQAQSLTAADIVNHYDERSLANLIYQYGEERRSRRIAKAILWARPLRGTKHLVEVVTRAVPHAPRQRIHPATRTFQAIRIAVNDELGELEKLLEQGPLALLPGGRMVVVSFHSLEDRLVKQAWRRWAARDVVTVLTRRVVRPEEEEILENPPSRSARLRACERTNEAWQPLN
jgi:16S rRNA (cytosine1402-N4)-methyltransferase